MVVETMLTALPSILLVIVSVGFLWAASWAISSLFTQYGWTAYYRAVPLLQVSICLGGILLLALFAGMNVASSAAAILAAIWCGSVIQETYLRAIYHTSVSPGEDSPAVWLSSKTQGTNGALSTKATDHSELGRQELSSPDTTLNAIQSRPLGQQFLNATSNQGKSSSRLHQPSIQLTALSDWIDLTQIPEHPLSKRPNLGKRTIKALRFPDIIGRQ